MTDAELTHLILHELQKVAPEADPESLSPDRPIREAVDIDSFDFLRVLIALSEATGVEIPEADYGKLETLSGIVRYFREHRP